MNEDEDGTGDGFGNSNGIGNESRKRDKFDYRTGESYDDLSTTQVFNFFKKEILKIKRVSRTEKEK